VQESLNNHENTLKLHSLIFYKFEKFFKIRIKILLNFLKKLLLQRFEIKISSSGKYSEKRKIKFFY